MALNLRYINTGKIREILRIHPRRWLILDKKELSYWIFAITMYLTILASIHTSFFWILSSYFPIVSSVMLMVSMLLSNSASEGIFTRNDFLPATISCLAILVYQNLTNGQNIFAIILSLFILFVYFALFRLDTGCFGRFSVHICKWTAVLTAISLFFFILHLIGFNLPERNVVYEDMYYFSDYRFFLVDDRSLFEIIPRFQSIFLEPGHMGTFLALLLATQIGKWKKWYNIILLVALFASFSLAAYGLLIIISFIHIWMKKRRVLPKALTIIILTTGTIAASYIYKGGDNMLNRLIAMRLELSDTRGIQGNNRVSASFESEFNSFLHSGDIFFGREMDKTTPGNAGYRVYLYEYGIIGFVFLYFFYILSIRGHTYRRAAVGMITLSLTNFWIRAYPLMFAFYIPYYLMAYLPDSESSVTKKINEDATDGE